MNDDQCNVVEPKTESTLCNTEPALPSKTEPTDDDLLAAPLPDDSSPYRLSVQSDDAATNGQLSAVFDFMKTNRSVEDTAVACPSNSHCFTPHSAVTSANESNCLFTLINVLSLSRILITLYHFSTRN